MKQLPPPLDELHRALRAEQDAEQHLLDELARGSLADRIAAGVAWPRLQVEREERRGRHHVLDLRAPRGVVLHDGLDTGDPVWLVAGGRRVRGMVIGRDTRVAEVRSDEELDGSQRVEVRRRADPSTWVRYRQALERGAEVNSRLVTQLLADPIVADRGVEVGALLEGLDDAQQRAADRALRAEHLAAIHGPPGTGKTHVLAAIAAHLVSRGDRPWALADSNSAVDHLALTLHRRGIHVVRIGRSSRMRDEVVPLGIEAQLARSPLAGALEALERDIGRATTPRERRDLVQRHRALRHQAEDHLLASAEVIVSTFGTLVRRAEHLPPAHTALVDEATQATEPAVWAAIPYVQRLILFGDPEQLGPVCRVPGALEVSLLERVLLEGRVEAPMLEVQHRMVSPLRELVAGVYGPAYRDADAAAAQQPVEGLRSLWIDTAGAGLEEAVDEATRSTYNEGEARVVALVVEQLLQAGVAASDIGVITPYSAQVGRLSALLDGIDIASVNAFQGQERPVIVASWVRSNPDGDLGFVADGRRLTVTLTRARRLLVMVGNSATLCAHPRFEALVAQLAARGDLQSVFEPPWSDTLLG